MPTAPGRNTRLENFFRNVSRIFTRSANTPTGQTAPLVAQIGQFSSESLRSRRYDEEYTEIPIRNAAIARELIQLRYRPEISTALDILVGDVFSSEDGDDLGFTIGETLNDGVTPVDSRILDIGLALIDRVLRGTILQTVVEEFLVYGDSFRSIILAPDYSQIQKLKQLPTWELFRVEDENSNVLRFEQRRGLSAQSDDQIFQIHPAVCVHWRYRQKFKYGRSLFQEVIEDSDALEQGYFAVEKAAMAIGVNPNVHTMPLGWNEKQCMAYQRAYENARDSQGRVMTDFFMMAGGTVTKLSQSWNPDLTALNDNVLQRRQRMAMRSRIPPWMIGLPGQGAREIAGQPALAYARFIGSIRSVLAEGLRQIIDIELAANGFTKDDMKYRMIFPKIYTNINTQSVVDPSESNLEGIEDSDRYPSRQRPRHFNTFDLIERSN